ncbi:uncharacterized protein METZ01_LOCUS511431, partial [marine metagenome]
VLARTVRGALGAGVVVVGGVVVVVVVVVVVGGGFGTVATDKPR